VEDANDLYESGFLELEWQVAQCMDATGDLAIIGSRNGMFFIDIQDTRDPQEIGFIDSVDVRDVELVDNNIS